MAIGFREYTLEEIPEQLRKLSAAELIRHGLVLRNFSRPDVQGQIHEGWDRQLREARAEWRRRHPVAPAKANRVSGLPNLKSDG